MGTSVSTTLVSFLFGVSTSSGAVSTAGGGSSTTFGTPSTRATRAFALRPGVAWSRSGISRVTEARATSDRSRHSPKSLLVFAKSFGQQNRAVWRQNEIQIQPRGLRSSTSQHERRSPRLPNSARLSSRLLTIRKWPLIPSLFLPSPLVPLTRRRKPVKKP